MNLHEQRIAELHATYENGRVADNIYFVKSKSRFRVKLGGKWIGTYWSFKGAVKARNEKLIKELEEQIAVLKKEMED
jgi:hypothetical protein